MARGSYIYFVQKQPTGQVLGTFTVKHECASWCAAVFLGDGPHAEDLPLCDVLRAPDKPSKWTKDAGLGVNLGTVGEFMEANGWPN